MTAAMISIRARPKQRPRVTNGRAYMTKDYLAWKDKCAVLIFAQGKPRYSCDVELRLTIGFAGHGGGDIDNLAGGFMDAANGILWDDDRRVCALRAVILRNQGADFIEYEVTPLWQT